MAMRKYHMLRNKQDKIKSWGGKMTFHEKMSWQIMYLPKKNKETVVLPVIYSVLADAI